MAHRKTQEWANTLLATHSSLAAYGVGRSLPSLTCSKVRTWTSYWNKLHECSPGFWRHCIPMLDCTLVSTYLSRIASTASGSKNVMVTQTRNESKSGNFQQKIQKASSTHPYGINSGPDGIDSKAIRNQWQARHFHEQITETLTAKEKEPTLRYDSLTKWGSAHFLQKCVPIIGRVVRRGGYSILLCTVR